jgi:hypothetical protein
MYTDLKPLRPDLDTGETTRTARRLLYPPHADRVPRETGRGTAARGLQLSRDTEE